jgi:DNA-binding transcriptional LysR family regulator
LPALPSISVQQLEYLLAVLDAPTWADAAAVVGVSPSALSQGIAELQRRIGVPLFERRGRRQLALPEAEVVADYARRVLGQTGDLMRWADEVRAGTVGRLRVGMIDVAAVDYFAGVLMDFRRDRSEIDLLLTVAPTGELMEQLIAGRLDVVVCVQPTSDVSGLDLQPILDEPLMLYAPASSKVGPAPTWGPWVSFPKTSNTRALIESALREEGVAFDVVAESNQPEVLREMVRLGIGWTVLPAAQAEREPHPLDRTRKRPVARRQLVMARRSTRETDPAGDHLCEELIAAASALKP